MNAWVREAFGVFEHCCKYDGTTYSSSKDALFAKLTKATQTKFQAVLKEHGIKYTVPPGTPNIDMFPSSRARLIQGALERYDALFPNEKLSITMMATTAAYIDDLLKKKLVVVDTTAVGTMPAADDTATDAAIGAIASGKPIGLQRLHEHRTKCIQMEKEAGDEHGCDGTPLYLKDEVISTLQTHVYQTARESKPLALPPHSARSPPATTTSPLAL